MLGQGTPACGVSETSGAYLKQYSLLAPTAGKNLLCHKYITSQAQQLPASCSFLSAALCCIMCKLHSTRPAWPGSLRRPCVVNNNICAACRPDGVWSNTHPRFKPLSASNMTLTSFTFLRNLTYCVARFCGTCKNLIGLQLYQRLSCT